jgi:23S rRNA pseudouridine1911/1915/1917 synthase
MLGQKRFAEQTELLERFKSGQIVIPEPAESPFKGVSITYGKGSFEKGGKGKDGGKGKGRPIKGGTIIGGKGGKDPTCFGGRPREDKSWWPEDEYDDPPFWWKNKTDVFFDIPITDEEDLTSLAPPVYQWWDPEKVAEAENFVAVSKPAGMFVVTDDKGLWEVSTTNFIHVSHQRFEMGSSNEPNQRGICHRLDSHTSGVQIFGKSWEAFRHFTKENSSHRVHKEYMALVDGRLGDGITPGQGLIDVPMHKWKDFDRREFGSVCCAHDGLPSVTKYKALRQWHVPATGDMEFLGKDRWFTLVQLRILSGRTHQIRLHMSIIGHPLIGDIKYNSRNFIEDSAFSPRIFLHCMKMEFKEFDGSLFVASGDLAPDLQAALSHIQRHADKGLEDCEKAGTLPGLGKILRDSKKDNNVTFPPQPDGTAEYWNEHLCPQPIVHRCLNCKHVEVMSVKMIQRKGNTAMHWKLLPHSGSLEGEDLKDIRVAPTIAQQEAAGERVWGPGGLWVPTALQTYNHEPVAKLDAEVSGDPASSDELGSHWGPLGTDWSWAHNGTAQNGWFRLCSGGKLSSKWGVGSWQVLKQLNDEKPLLLVEFSGVEHALRLMEGEETRFDVACMRRIKDGETSLKEDPMHLNNPTSAYETAVCTAQGWPGIQS